MSRNTGAGHRMEKPLEMKQGLDAKSSGIKPCISQITAHDWKQRELRNLSISGTEVMLKALHKDKAQLREVLHQHQVVRGPSPQGDFT